MKAFLTILATQLFLISFNTQGQIRSQIDLNTDWKIATVTESEDPIAIPGILNDRSRKWYRGDMPKQVQEFILEKGELPDPAVRDNAEKWVEVFQKDWIYVKEFGSPAYKGNINLCFDGLDTEADVYLN